MADVRMPYALDQDQRLVHVNDVQRGAAAGCACPAGGQPVWAKPGDELSRHFAHAVDTVAPGATESALHMAAQNDGRTERQLHPARQRRLPDMATR